MKILMHQHIRKDVGALTTFMKKEMLDKTHYNWMKFVNSDIYSIEFEFIWEDEKDFKNYWLYVWRLQRSINSYIENILKVEDKDNLFGYKADLFEDIQNLKITITDLITKLDKFLQQNK